MKFLIAFVGSVLCFQSCSKDNFEETVFVEPMSVQPSDEAVELGSVSINAFVKDVIEIKTGKPFELEDVLDEMVVQIIDRERDGFRVFNSNYRDTPVQIPLTPGNYSLLISNYAFSPARFDAPVHGALLEYFSITAGSNTPLDLELALFDVAATINFSNELTISYPDISARVEYIQDGFGIGPNLTWTTADKGRTGYLNTYAGDFGFELFYATTGTLTLEVTASGSFGTPVTINKTYPGVNANQHYNIAIEQTAPATASLTVTLGDENVIEDIVNFPN